MAKKLYVANLSFKATEEDVEELFKEHGAVTSVRLIYGEQGRHRGFGFVEMAEDEGAKAAREALSGASFMDRDLVVDEARDRGAAGGGGGQRDRGNSSRGDWPRSSHPYDRDGGGRSSRY